MPRLLRAETALLALLLSACAASAPIVSTGRAAPGRAAPGRAAPGLRRDTAGTERTAVLLAINDVYRIEGVANGTLGGYARLRTLRRELERDHPDMLTFHAGDLLFPSLLSRVFAGAQMIDVLDRLDGDPQAFDSRLFVTFGNHEFEKSKLKDAPLLSRRVHDSQFRWLAGNFDFVPGADGKLVIAGENVAPSYLVTSGGIRFGVFGLTVGDIQPQYATAFRDPVATARALSADLRARGAEVVVGLTHLDAAVDRRILRELGAAGPDLILGGHDHEHVACNVGGRLLLKADEDARTANVVTVTVRADGSVAVRHTLRAIDASLAEDPTLNVAIDAWRARHEGVFCGLEAGAKATVPDPFCLGEKLGTTATTIDAEESHIRSTESALGDWIADRMLETFRGCGAQAAFVNSGSLRLYQDLPPGSEILRRHVEELFAFPAPVYMLRIDGRTLQQVAQHAIDYWPGAGNWLQIAGFGFDHDTATGKVSNLRLLTPAGPRPIQPDEALRVVANLYLFDRTGDRDGFTMLHFEQIDPDCALNAHNYDLKNDIVIPAIRTAGAIAPRSDGRIHQDPPPAAVNLCGDDPSE